MTIEFRKLQKSDKRAGFTCGVAELDLFFVKYAGQNQYRHYLGVTYLAVQDDNILGFVTVSPCAIEADTLPETITGKLSVYPLPMLRLARFAVSTHTQGQGVGKLLLRGAFTLALELRDTVGCVGVVTDAKPDAITFYEQYGFKQYVLPIEGQITGPPKTTPMYLSIKLIAKAVSL